MAIRRWNKITSSKPFMISGFAPFPLSVCLFRNGRGYFIKLNRLVREVYNIIGCHGFKNNNNKLYNNNDLIYLLCFSYRLVKRARCNSRVFFRMKLCKKLCVYLRCSQYRRSLISKSILTIRVSRGCKSLLYQRKLVLWTVTDPVIKNVHSYE